MALPLLGQEKGRGAPVKAGGQRHRPGTSDDLERELQFDYELGNISEEQYRLVRKGVVGKPEGAWGMEEDPIEQEVRRLRMPHRACSRCGATFDIRGTYCPGCGFKLADGNRPPDRKG